MKSSIGFNAALILAAGIGGLAAASTASAGALQDEFLGCDERHWTGFGAAATSDDADRLARFIDTLGGSCQPLQRTAVVLLCDLDPAACLQEIEPAAGEPNVELVPEGPFQLNNLTDRFAYRAPGEHIGWENDSSTGNTGNDDNGGGGSGSQTSSSGTSSGGNVGTSRTDSYGETGAAGGTSLSVGIR